VLYGLLALVALAYRADLTWAARALPVYAAGGFPRPLEISLFDRAARRLRAGTDPAGSRALLERSLSLAIDPLSPAILGLAESYRLEGSHERALEELQRYLEIDPSSLFAYLRAAQIYREQGREEERRRMLERGLAYFARYTAEYRPRTDETVERRFNQKAERVYRYYERALRSLRAEL
jgi:tetratricopeptide (TPR) repeat protein